MKRVRSCIVAGLLLAAASPALADPPPPAAQPQLDPRLYPAFGLRMGRAATTLQTYFDAQHRQDPTAPDFETVFKEAVLARGGDLVQSLLRRLQPMIDAGLIDERNAGMAQAIMQGQPLANFSRADQDRFIDNVLDSTFTMARTGNGLQEDMMLWFAAVLDRVATVNLPEGHPIRVSARTDLRSAEDLLHYDTQQTYQDINLAEHQVNQHRDEVRDQIRENIQNYDPSRPPPQLTLGTVYNGITVYPDGSVSGGFYSGEGYAHASSEPEWIQFESRLGSTEPFPQRLRDRVTEWVRTNHPGHARQWLAQILPYMDRVNRATRRHAEGGGAGGGGGGSGSGGGEANLPTVWDDFLDIGGTLTVAQLEPIYAGYDPFDPFNTAGSHAGQSFSSAGTSPSSAGTSLSSAGTSPSSLGNSLSAAGTSFSSVGNSLSAAGTSLSSVGTTPDYGWGGGISLAGSPTMSLAGGPWEMPPPLNTTVNLHFGWNGLYQDAGWNRTSGGYGLVLDPFRTLGAFTPGAQLAAYTSGLDRDGLIRVLQTSGVSGLNRLLAQPFNVLLTWGPNAFDVDLHMTGPSGNNDGSRFHIYYAQRGSQAAFPFVELIRDCICASGSEVILMSRLLEGGVYRISAFNFGNQSTSSTQLTTAADLQLLIVRGGTAVSVGNGTTIQGGTVVFRGTPTPGQAGNTWTGVEIDPRTGQIRFVDQANNSGGGDGGAANLASAALRTTAGDAGAAARAAPSARGGGSTPDRTRLIEWFKGKTGALPR